MLGYRLEEIFNEINNIKSLEELTKYSESILKFDIRSIIDEKKRVSNFKTYIKNSLCKALMNKEKELCPQNKTKPLLTKLFSKKLYNGHDIDKLPLYGHKRTVGTVPKIFLEKSKNKKETTIKIFDLLAEYSMKLNYDFEFKIDSFEGEKELLVRYISQFEKELSNITKQNVKLEFIGSGFNGNGFKLTINNHCYCYKTFYVYNPEDAPNTCCHGTVAETQMALYASKNSRKGQFAKFFFGKVGYKYNIDSFVVTEYINKNNNRNKNNRFYIDHITTMDSNPRNRVSGKIIDFGATKIGIPELNNNRLRQLVRIICNCMYLHFDESKISYRWSLNRNNLLQLHNYLKDTDKQLYTAAFDIILQYSVGIPKNMQKYFYTLKENYPEKDLIFEEILSAKHLFTKDVESLKYYVNSFNILKTQTEPMALFDSPGHIIIELYNEYQCVCFYKETVEKIRLEKFVNDKFETILEIEADNFIKYQDYFIHELLH